MDLNLAFINPYKMYSLYFSKIYNLYLSRLFHVLVCVTMKMMPTKLEDFKMKLITLNKNLLMELPNRNTTQSVDHFILSLLILLTIFILCLSKRVYEVNKNIRITITIGTIFSEKP